MKKVKNRSFSGKQLTVMLLQFETHLLPKFFNAIQSYLFIE